MESTGFEAALETVEPAIPPARLTAPQPPRNTGNLFVLFFLALALGVTARFLLPSQLHALLAGPNMWSIGGFGALLAALALSIVLHEAGHLTAALVLKFDVLGLALGPIRATRLNGAWQLRFSPRTLFSGSVSAMPRTTHAWRGRMLAVVAAGPLATVVTGSAAALLLLSHPANASINAFVGGFVQLSAFIFVLGLVPNSPDARIRNDARLLLVLQRDCEEAREILSYHLLTQLELAGVRPRDYPLDLMHRVARAHGRPDLMLFSAHKIVLWALDCGRFATAEAWDVRCLELSDFCQAPSRNLALASSACLDVLLRNRPAEAVEKFAEVDWDTLSPAWLMHRSRAAYYLATGDVPECLAEVSRAQYSAPRPLPFFTFELTLLSQIHRRALNLPSPPLTASCAA